MEIAFKYKVKQSKNGKFPSNYKLVQSILKRKCPSIDKPLQKKAPEKGPLKNISPGAYFWNFTVDLKMIAMKHLSSLELLEWFVSQEPCYYTTGFDFKCCLRGQKVIGTMGSFEKQAPEKSGLLLGVLYSSQQLLCFLLRDKLEYST